LVASALSPSLSNSLAVTLPIRQACPLLQSTYCFFIIIIIIITITDLYSAFRSEDTEALGAAQED